MTLRSGRARPPSSRDALRDLREWRLDRFSSTLCKLEQDTHANVQTLTDLCGELFQADCAMYNRLDGDVLRAKAVWHAPPGMKLEDTARGHLCFEVIEREGDGPLVVRDLPQTRYAQTDPNVLAYGLRTYLGHPVRFGGVRRGSLCVVSTRDIDPSDDDLRLLGLIASAIGQEEERARADEALWVKNSALECAASAVVLFDLAGNVTYANRAFLAQWGYDAADQVVGAPAIRFWSAPDDPSAIVEAMRRDGSWTGELTCFARDGSTFLAQILASIVRDRRQAPLCVVASFLDVTAQRRVERCLREQEQRLRLALQLAKQGLFDIDLRTGEAVVSEEYARMLGWDPGELRDTRTRLNERLHPDDRERVGSAYRDYVEGKASTFTTEFRLRARDGAWKWILSVAQIVERDAQGVPVRMLGTHTDITERKRAEDERFALERRRLHAQKLESLGVMAGGIAHDYNNLLCAVIGNLELVGATLPVGSDVQDSIHDAMQSAQRAAALTRQMLAYAGKGAFVLADIDIDSIVRANADLLRASVPKTATLRLELHAGPATVRADAGQVQQVIMNLVANAAEAVGSAAGSVALTTGVGEYGEEALVRSRLDVIPSAGAFVWLEVVDDGCGMEDATLHRLFEPFFSTRFTGRGLGMSAVQGIVRSHGGAIFVDSQPGEGARVRVLFPALPSASRTAPEPPPPAAVAPARSPEDRRRTILVVDDEETVRSVCRRMLEWLGWEVLVAEGGAEAIQTYQAHADRIACVILDLSMPGMDGIATLRELRRIRVDAPVVLTSGYTESQAHERFPGGGVAAFVQKPYTMEQLRERVSQVAGRRSS